MSSMQDIHTMQQEGYKIPELPLPFDLETKEVLKQVNRATRKLAELKGVAQTIPNERILINSLTLQEAKDSSAVENIVTTQDDLYRAGLDINYQFINAATKEVLFYHPYTKIDHVVANMQVSRQTASKYLDRIVSLGLLQKEKMGKENYYINTRLMNLFIEFGRYEPTEAPVNIESVHVNETPNL